MTHSMVMAEVDLAGLKRFASRCAKNLPHACVIGLSGTLGAGKTTFTQAFAQACGVDPLSVTSPTFTLVQQYVGDRTIYHIDAYRMADEDEFVQLGGEELLEQPATVLIEWPQRIAGCLPREMLQFTLQIDDGTQSTRTIILSTTDSQLAALLPFITADDGHTPVAAPEQG